MGYRISNHAVNLALGRQRLTSVQVAHQLTGDLSRGGAFRVFRRGVSIGRPERGSKYTGRNTDFGHCKYDERSGVETFSGKLNDTQIVTRLARCSNDLISICGHTRQPTPYDSKRTRTHKVVVRDNQWNDLSQGLRGVAGRFGRFDLQIHSSRSGGGRSLQY